MRSGWSRELAQPRVPFSHSLCLFVLLFLFFLLVFCVLFVFFLLLFLTLLVQGCRLSTLFLCNLLFEHTWHFFGDPIQFAAFSEQIFRMADFQLQVVGALADFRGRTRRTWFFFQDSLERCFKVWLFVRSRARVQVHRTGFQGHRVKVQRALVAQFWSRRLESLSGSWAKRIFILNYAIFQQQKTNTPSTLPSSILQECGFCHVFSPRGAMIDQSHHPRCRHIRRLPPPQWWTRHTHPKDRYLPGLPEKENETAESSFERGCVGPLTLQPLEYTLKYTYSVTSLMWYNTQRKKLKLCLCKDPVRMCHCRVIDQPITDTCATHPLHIFTSRKRLKIGIQSPPCHVHHVDTSWAPTTNATHGMRQQISRNAFGHCMVKVFNGKTWWLASYPSCGIHVEWSCSMLALLMNFWTLWHDVNRMFLEQRMQYTAVYSKGLKCDPRLWDRESMMEGEDWLMPS